MVSLVRLHREVFLTTVLVSEQPTVLESFVKERLAFNVLLGISILLIGVKLIYELFDLSLLGSVLHFAVSP